MRVNVVRPWWCHQHSASLMMGARDIRSSAHDVVYGYSGQGFVPKAVSCCQTLPFLSSNVSSHPTIRHQTSTIQFIAVEVLRTANHTSQHNLESFLHVLLCRRRHGIPVFLASSVAEFVCKTHEAIGRIATCILLAVSQHGFRCSGHRLD
jgi:hypothetical protein